MDLKPKQVDFMTPEQVAAHDAATEPRTESHPAHRSDGKAKGQGKKHRFHLTKKQWINVGIAAAILLIGGSYLIWKVFLNKPPAPVAVIQEPEPEPAPTSEKSNLTGLTVPLGTNENTPVTAVMIENSPDARPQAGLRDAGVVYEAITEGGITRFAALYQEAKPDYIGPVRSARPQFLEFIKPYDAAIAHAGGSGEALARIRNEKFKDLDYTVAGGAYERVATRYAPHNLYTSRAKLLAEHKSRGWTKSSFTGMTRAEKEGKPGTVTAGTIDLTISSHLYNPSFAYNKSSNSYRRSLGGQAHTDEKTGKQITPKVVVALVMPHRYAGIYSVYASTGSGSAFVFQNGTVTKATWEKSKTSAQLKLVDAEGKDVPLNPGQTWFTLVNDKGQVAYKP
jgi:hypothetical protein